MNPPTLPASPWQASPLPDSRAIITGDGYFLLNLEGLDSPPQTAAALRRAVAALPDLLTIVERWRSHGQDIAEAWDQYGMHPDTINHLLDDTESALRKAGYTFPDDQKPE
jgi:hypothetical protein